MSEKVRSTIQAEVCRAFTAMNQGDQEAAQAALFRILDQLDRPEVLEHAATRLQRGAIQFLMQ